MPTCLHIICLACPPFCILFAYHSHLSAYYLPIMSTFLHIICPSCPLFWVSFAHHAHLSAYYLPIMPTFLHIVCQACPPFCILFAYHAQLSEYHLPIMPTFLHIICASFRISFVQKAWSRIHTMRKLKFKLDSRSFYTIYLAFIRWFIWDNCNQYYKKTTRKDPKWSRGNVDLTFQPMHI